MRRQSLVLIVSAVAVVTAAAAGLDWWQMQRAHALPAYIVKSNGRLEFVRIDIAVKNPGRIVKECLAWRGLSPLMIGVQP
jgi:hypothetical protein